MPDREVTLAVASGVIRADLAEPSGPRGVVLFAHGSGSSRRSRRNREVAAALRAGGFATLLVDLLTEAEAAEDDVTRRYRFDIPRLAARLIAAIDAVPGLLSDARLPIGCFGASTGAAAALIAAGERASRVGAVVSRGGRPDLAGAALSRVRAPTLLIVGGRDLEVLELNRQAAARIAAPTVIEIVPGATHLFEEPGALVAVTRLALHWFQRHLIAA